eukprot:scaffold17051_cov160-Amphora_coffeaeformis.AAC.1
MTLLWGRGVSMAKTSRSSCGVFQLSAAMSTRQDTLLGARGFSMVAWASQALSSHPLGLFTNLTTSTMHPYFSRRSSVRCLTTQSALQLLGLSSQSSSSHNQHVVSTLTMPQLRQAYFAAAKDVIPIHNICSHKKVSSLLLLLRRPPRPRPRRIVSTKAQLSMVTTTFCVSRLLTNYYVND